jgi:hypothetical protein
MYAQFYTILHHFARHLSFRRACKRQQHCTPSILLTDDSARFLRRIDAVTTDKVRGKTRTSFAYTTDIVRRR